MSPAMKAMRQPLSSPRKFNRPLKMPLMPAIRPVDSISSTAESPISAPPIAADTGVKLAMTDFHSIRAFSSEVDTGSRKENASKQKPNAPDHRRALLDRNSSI